LNSDKNRFQVEQIDKYCDFILDLKIIMNRMANMVIADLDAISVVNKGWGEQFKEAMNVNGGDVESAKMIDYIMHFFAFPWKVI